MHRHASRHLWPMLLWLSVFAVTRIAVAAPDPDPLTPAQRTWLGA